MKLVPKEISVVFAVLLLTASAFAQFTNTPANPAARVTTDYIDAKISLDYPGFEGLSVDSLGKEHFPLVTIKPPAQPWRPTQATCQGSRVEYRRPSGAGSEPPRWTIEIKMNEIRLESHWSAEDPPEPLVLDADASISHVTLLGLMEKRVRFPSPAPILF